MQSRSIPAGSMWSVVTPGGHPLRGTTLPKRVGIDTPLNGQVFFSRGEILVIGGEDFDTFLGNRHHFVEVILPVHCWLNRVLFNENMDYLRRIA